MEENSLPHLAAPYRPSLLVQLEKVLVLGMQIVFVLSVLYLIIAGIYYLSKRERLGPKWLLGVAIVLALLSIPFFSFGIFMGLIGIGEYR